MTNIFCLFFVITAVCSNYRTMVRGKTALLFFYDKKGQFYFLSEFALFTKILSQLYLQYKTKDICTKSIFESPSICIFLNIYNFQCQVVRLCLISRSMKSLTKYGADWSLKKKKLSSQTMLRYPTLSVHTHVKRGTFLCFLLF